MELVLDALGVEVVHRDLLRFADNAGDVSSAMDDVLEIVRAGERRQFDSEGGYGSGGWPRLAASTIEQKQRSNLDPRILRATGALFDSLTRRGGANISIARHDGADFGTTLPYARYHQQGRGVPKRPPVQPPERDRRSMIKVIQRHLIEGR